jgi:hypothetical protein
LPLQVSVYLIQPSSGGSYGIHGLHDQTSPGQELKTYVQTDGNDIQPRTTQTINEGTSAGSNLITAQNKACALPEFGRIGRPKHVEANSPKCFKQVFKSFKY